MSDDTIIKVTLDPEAVDQVATAIAEILDDMDVERPLAIIALLSMAVIAMNPNVSPETMQQITLDTSAYMATLLSTDPSTDPSKVN
jgi:hypothetical protein